MAQKIVGCRCVSLRLKIKDDLHFIHKMKNRFLSANAKNLEYISIAAIMLIAAAMRFYHYAGWSLSNDELSALNRLRFDGFFEMIRLGVRIDGHPAGTQALLWWISKTTGIEVWMIRLPFVIFGILAVYYVFRIGKRWFGGNTGLYAAAGIAFLQYPILYSQLARPYSPGMLFSVMAIYYWTLIVFDKNRKPRHYLSYAASTVLALYSHHFSFLLMLIVGVSGFAFYRQIQWFKYLGAAFLVFVFYSPHLEIFFHQLSLGGVGGPDGWLSPPTPRWILDYLWYAFNGKYLMLIFPAILIASLLSSHPKITKFHILALSWFLLMFLIGYFYSLWRNPILQYSILLFSFPLLVLFMFSFLKQKITPTSTILLIIFMLIGMGNTVFINKFYSRQHFGEFKDVAQNIAKWNSRFGKENISNIIVVSGPYYIHYYLDKSNPGIQFLQYNIAAEEDLGRLSQIVDSVQTPYLSYAWTKPAPREADLIIREKFPCVLSRTNYGGLSEVTLYGQKAGDSCLALPEPVFTFSRNYEQESSNQNNASINHSSSSTIPSGAFCLDDNTIYATGFKSSVGKINGGRFDRIELEISVFSPLAPAKTLFVLQIEHAGKQYFWRGVELQNYITKGEWSKGFMSVRLPEFQSAEDEINIYGWNPGKKVIYIDDLELRFYQD